MSKQQEGDYVQMAEEGEEHDVKTLTRGEFIYVKFVRPGLAEFFGLLLFVFVDIMAVYSTQRITGIAIAHGFSLFVLVTIMAPISGGHLNPAVTLGVFISGKMKWPLLILYPIAQLLGALVGAFLALVMKIGVPESKSPTSLSPETIRMAGHFPIDGLDPGRAILGEAIITFLLVLVVLMTTDNKNKTGFAPLAIGVAVLCGVLCSGHVTGGSMNPARSFGPAISALSLGKMKPIENLYIYFVGPLIGGALAAVIYKLVFASADSRWVMKKTD